MATLEHEATHEATHEAAHEATREISIRLSREQADGLERAALATGQSLETFAASLLLRAADGVLTPPSVRALSGWASDATRARASQGGDPLDKIMGIFKDEPLMDALMERIREDRRREIEADATDETRSPLPRTVNTCEPPHAPRGAFFMPLDIPPESVYTHDMNTPRNEGHV